MIEHEAEIHSRPARTWFQSSKEKEKAEGRTSYDRPSPNCPHFLPTAISKQQYEAGFKGDSKAKEKSKSQDTKVRPRARICILETEPGI